jgi:hypothetical protein
VNSLHVSLIIVDHVLFITQSNDGIKSDVEILVMTVMIPTVSAGMCYKQKLK